MVHHRLYLLLECGIRDVTPLLDASRQGRADQLLDEGVRRFSVVGPTHPFLCLACLLQTGARDKTQALVRVTDGQASVFLEPRRSSHQRNLRSCLSGTRVVPLSYCNDSSSQKHACILARDVHVRAERSVTCQGNLSTKRFYAKLSVSGR